MTVAHRMDDEPNRGPETAERAFLLWIVLYALLVILLVGNNVVGRGLPLVDGFGRSALMQPVGELHAEFAGAAFEAR